MKKPKKSSTTTIWYHHTQNALTNQFHILQYLFCNKITTIPNFKTSMGVHSKNCNYTSKGVSIYYTIFPQYPPYNTKVLQIYKSGQIQNFSKNITFFSPSPKFNSNPFPIILSLYNTDATSTTTNLPVKLQHLAQQYIDRSSDPSINHLLRINAVLDFTKRKKWFNTSKSWKGQRKKLGPMAAQNNLQDLHMDKKMIIRKETTRYFYSSVID